MNVVHLSRRLAALGIHSKSIRIDGVIARGYLSTAFGPSAP